ncbi:hypothetical protein EDB83DRAFT_2319304 [Lactarius deliciosus]|nr:hypothetical protein EDB83DRAFT_2319304 [Lactarius deliciosus]
MELAAEGFIDGPPRMPASAAMDPLLERRVACSRGGLFAKAVEEHGAVRRLVASWLPSHEADETQLVVDDIKDFALDPAQDLIVLLEQPSRNRSQCQFERHLRRHGHPRTPQEAQRQCRRAPSRCEGARAVPPFATRDVDLELDDGARNSSCVRSFHLAFLLTAYPGNQFIHGGQAPERIWDFSPSSPREHYMLCVSLVAQAANPRRHAAPSHAPPKPRAVRAHDDNGPFLARPPTGSPLSFARTARVHVFTLHHDPGAHRGRWQLACFVMHNRTLMRYVEAYRDDGASAMDVSWEEWGPTETRFFVLANGVPMASPSGECRVEVLDLNVHPSRAPTAAEKFAASRLEIDLEEPIEGSRLVCEPSVFPTGRVFARRSSLLCALGQRESYMGYMIDEQRLLGLKFRCAVSKSVPTHAQCTSWYYYDRTSTSQDSHREGHV